MFKTAAHDLQFYNSVPQTAVIKSTWTTVTVVFDKTSLLWAFWQQCPLNECVSSRQLLVPSTCSCHLYSLKGSQRTLGVKTPGLDKGRDRNSPDQGGGVGIITGSKPPLCQLVTASPSGTTVLLTSVTA
jgi:hypothetical protein